MSFLVWLFIQVGQEPCFSNFLTLLGHSRWYFLLMMYIQSIFLQYFSNLFVLVGSITVFLDTLEICSLKIKKVSLQSCLLFTLLFNINWVSLRYSDESHFYIVDGGR